jgi:biotin operon repressor
VRKSKNSGGNLALNNQPQSGKPVGATHNFNRQKFNELIQENHRISQKAIAQKLNIGLASVNEIIAGLGYKKVLA